MTERPILDDRLSEIMSYEELEQFPQGHPFYDDKPKYVRDKILTRLHTLEGLNSLRVVNKYDSAVLRSMCNDDQDWVLMTLGNQDEGLREEYRKTFERLVREHFLMC